MGSRFRDGKAGVPSLLDGRGMMDDVIVARALHVLAVVIWIGGVAMATTVVLPAVRRGDLGLRQVPGLPGDRASLRLAGAHGNYLGRVDRLLHDLAARSVGPLPHGQLLVDARHGLPCGCCSPSSCSSPSRSFCTAISGTGRRRGRTVAFAWLHRAHWVLLALSVVTILGAVAGSQGWSIF